MTTKELSKATQRIEKDHAKISGLIEEMIKVAGAKPFDENDALTVMADYIEVADHHMQFEELVMRRSQYPDNAKHVKAHQELLTRTGEILFRFETDTKGHKAKILLELADDASAHYAEWDSAFAKHLKLHEKNEGKVRKTTTPAISSSRPITGPVPAHSAHSPQR